VLAAFSRLPEFRPLPDAIQPKKSHSRNFLVTSFAVGSCNYWANRAMILSYTSTCAWGSCNCSAAPATFSCTPAKRSPFT
jgi:hypothetical protein